MYVNDRWCSNISIKQQQCSPDIELLTVALHPFYLPREFPRLLVTVVYISPSANVDVAANKIHDVILDLKTSSPDAVKLIMGDFNQWEYTLPHYHQCVYMPTRELIVRHV